MSNAPIVDFVGLSGKSVLATYENLPPNSRIVIVSRTSGQPISGGGVEVGGSASATLPEPTGIPSGDYFLKAEDSTGAYLAQSVVFYIDDPAGPSSA
jgi:hypothetical protein